MARLLRWTVVASLLLLGACATPVPKYRLTWPAGMAEPVARSHERRCFTIAYVYPPPYGFGAYLDAGLFQSCMNVNGVTVLWSE